MRPIFIRLFMISAAAWLSSCGPSDFRISSESPPAKAIPPGPNELRYIFIGRGMNEADPEHGMDPRLVQTDFTHFAAVWHGGNMSFATTSDSTTGREEWAKGFSLKDPRIMLAPGWHEFHEGSFDKLLKLTGKNDFYSTHFRGITTVVLNTHYGGKIPADCARQQAQLDLIRNVCDTLQRSSHLILLMNSAVSGKVDSKVNAAANVDASGWKFLCNNDSSTWDKAVHPLLKQVRARHIPVIVLSGDFGFKSKQYYSRDEYGIDYLASATAYADKHSHAEYVNCFQPDRVIIFTHDTVKHSLRFRFEYTDSLPYLYGVN